MQKNQPPFFLFSIILCVLAFTSTSHGVDKYPVCFTKIEKASANYDTAEQAFISKKSALLSKDLAWYYETLTVETATTYKELFQQAGIDPNRHFDTVSTADKTKMLGKLPYKEGVILLIETITPEGIILRGPVTLIQENGLWKTTSKYSGDEELNQYLEVLEPPLSDNQRQNNSQR